VTGEGKLGQALGAPETASREELIKLWRRLYKSEPLRYASREFLARAISYAMQEQEFGGLPASARRELLAIAKGEPVSAPVPPIKIKPGARLLREWHGTTHEVLVTGQGFVWNGATYRSLSAIAFAITGAKWNGRRFFGLVNGRRGANG